MGEYRQLYWITAGVRIYMLLPLVQLYPHIVAGCDVGSAAGLYNYRGDVVYQHGGPCITGDSFQHAFMSV